MENIVSYSEALFKQLKNDHYLRGLDMCAFCQKGAYYFGEINMIHPFREGNGRTQRVFLQFLAKAAGYLLDFKSLTVRQMENASIRSASVDNKGFYDILKKSVRMDKKMSQSR